MKKQTKNIIIALAVLLVLGIAAGALLMTPDNSIDLEEAASQAQGEAELLVDHVITDVKEVVIENGLVNETWTLIPTKDENAQELNNVFTFKGWEDENVNLTEALAVARSFYMMYSVKEIGEVEDLSEYGLDDGTIKAVVEYTDGTKETIIIGSAAGESTGRYMLYDGKVHIGAFSEYLAQKQVDFIDTEVLKMKVETQTDVNGEVTEAESFMQHIRLSGKNYPEEILLQESDDAVLKYEVSEPIFTGANETQINAIIDQVQSITASGVAAVNATEEDLKIFGFEEPTAVIDFEINNEAHVIRVGTRVNGEYSLMVDDSDTVFVVPESSIDSWVNKSLYDLRDGFVRLASIFNVEKLTVEDASGKDVYDVDRVKNEERSSEDMPYYDLAITKDGEPVDYETAYQPFYTDMLSVYVLNEEIIEKPEGDPMFAIHFEHVENGGTEIVEYYAVPDNDRRCVAVVNGEAVGVVRMSDIEDLIAKKAAVGNFEAIAEAD